MRKRRTHIVQQVLCLFLAAVILNFSVDSPDRRPKDWVYHHEDVSINDIESIYEMILEMGFKIKNAVPEHEEPDSKCYFQKKLDPFSYTLFTYFLPVSGELFKPATLLIDRAYYVSPRDIHPPPPKV